MARFYFILFIIYLVLGTAFAEDNLALLPVPDAVFCQALLTTIKPGASARPLGSLRQIQEILQKRRSLKKDPGGYWSFHAAQDLNNPLRFIDRRMHSYILARLKQLDRDTTVAFSPDYAYAGFEFRGEKEIRDQFEDFNTALENLNPRVWDELNKIFPKRRSFLGLTVVSGVIAGLSSFMIMISPDSFGITSAVITTLFGVASDKFITYLRSITGRQRGVIEQSNVIERTLAEPTPTYPFVMLSGSFQADTELHRQIMNPSKTPELDLTVAASEPAAIGPFDRDREAREISRQTEGMNLSENLKWIMDKMAKEAALYPEGRYRHVFYDSIFYRDPDTNEPVWLIYYRSFKTNPFKDQKPPDPPKKKSESKEWSIEPGYGLKPIPISN